MTEQKRYDAMDGLRAFSCIGILAMHVLINGNYGLKGFVYDKLINSFTNLIFLFMIISAFGLCCGYYERFIDGSIDIVAFYKKRYIKIFPFFALLCFLDFIVSPSVNALYEVFANLTLCFGLIPNAEISVIGVGWFLGTLFVFYFMFPFFCFLLAEKRRAWFSFGVSIIMHYICFYYFGAGIRTIVYSFAFFVSGGLVYLYREHLVGKTAKLVSIIVLAISCLVYYLLSDNLFMIILINVSLLIIAINVSGKGLLINGFTKHVGEVSFEIYLCHMLIFRVFEKIHLLKVTGNDYWDYGIALCMTAVGSIMFAILWKTISNKFLAYIKGKH